MLARRTTILLAVLTGVALEVGIEMLSGGREAWDSSLYWTVGVPAALVVAGLIGYWSRGSNWIWAVLIVPAQMFAMAYKARDFSLLPLGLMLGVLLSLPFLGAAFLGQRIRPRR